MVGAMLIAIFHGGAMLMAIFNIKLIVSRHFHVAFSFRHVGIGMYRYIRRKPLKRGLRLQRKAQSPFEFRNYRFLAKICHFSTCFTPKFQAKGGSLTPKAPFAHVSGNVLNYVTELNLLTQIV